MTELSLSIVNFIHCVENREILSQVATKKREILSHQKKEKFRQIDYLVFYSVKICEREFP